MPDTIKDRSEHLFNEWKECRSSIERFDKIIVDIRKYGFTLLTGLLSADAFLFAKLPELSLEGKAAVSILMMVLIYALFMVDRYHEIFLRGAVQRAKVIESELELGLTTTISKVSEDTKTDTWGVKLYKWFIFASAVPPLATTVKFDLADVEAKWGFIIFMILVMFFFCGLIWRYDHLTRPDVKRKPRNSR
jgi:hypothetical protein